MQRMTLDEVVAGNVTRLREEREWSKATLARKLGASRHFVYEIERPRAGRELRSFTWDDLVALCAALETTLFELVLPPEGTVISWEGRPPWIAAGQDFEIGRNELGLMLFAIPGDKIDQKALENVAKSRERAMEDRLRRVEELILKWMKGEEE